MSERFSGWSELNETLFKALTTDLGGLAHRVVCAVGSAVFQWILRWCMSTLHWRLRMISIMPLLPSVVMELPSKVSNPLLSVSQAKHEKENTVVSSMWFIFRPGHLS